MVAPLLHDQELPAEAVSVTLPPWQNASGPPALIVAVGRGFTVTFVAGDVLVQPEVVTVTVYAPLVFTLIDCVVAPLLQLYEVPLLAVRVTDPPWQKVVAPLAVTEACATVVIVRVTAVRVLLSQFVVEFTLAA